MSSVKKYMQYVQEALPAKLKAIHVMNTASFFDKILFLLKPFIKADILEMVCMQLYYNSRYFQFDILNLLIPVAPAHIKC